MTYENYIIAEILIDENNINKEQRIINSYEQKIKESKLVQKENDYHFYNEQEIKDSCNIIIDDIPIKFSYFYKFNKEVFIKLNIH